MTILPPNQQIRCLSLAEILSATQNFDQEMIIGSGGFGKVYRGRIESENGGNTEGAFKRLHHWSAQGPHEFNAELDMLSRLRHSHLVSLLGFCVDGDEMIIIYEYMPQGSLYDHLHHPSGAPLSWKQRLNIGIGAAEGLVYLHTGAGTTEAVIHRDLKSTNILLDNDWEAKISDFGLAKLCPTSHVTTNVKGTHGYLDPYYERTRHLNMKTDIYAFGVILFELLSGKRADVNLAGLAKSCAKKKKFKELVAPDIEVCDDSLKAFAKIANLCLHEDPKKRPLMSKVLSDLQQSLSLQKTFEAERDQQVGSQKSSWFSFVRQAKEKSGNRDRS